MRNKPLVLCGLVAMLSIFGAFVHWLQTQQGFETDTGLAITNSPLHIVMIVCMAAFALWLWWYMRGFRDYTCPRSYPQALACAHPLWNVGAIGFAVIMMLGSLAMLFRVIVAMRSASAATGVYTSLLQKMSSLGVIFNLVLAILAFIAAICFIVFASGCNSKRSSGGPGASIFIVIFFCFRLIATYKNYASDPVVWHFAIQILSVAACLLAWYYIAGFCFNSPKPRSAVYFSFLGAFLSIISCADSVSFGVGLISVGTAGMLLLVALAQLTNMKAPGSVPVSQPSEENGQAE